METAKTSPANQQAFFDQAYERTLCAERQTGTYQATLQVGDSIVRLVFAGGSLVPELLPALEHLRIEGDPPPEMTIHLWDTDSTGIQMLSPPCPLNRIAVRGEVWDVNSDRFKLAFHWGDFSVNLIDLDRNIGIYWVKTPDNMPVWVNAAPLRTPLHWWMEKTGRQLMHAAAIGTEDGAILITGKGGVGKSTTALSCLASGLNYLADDYLIVGLDPEPTVYSLYSTAKLDAEQVARFPQLAAAVTGHEKLQDDKAVMFLHPHFHDQIVASAPLVAVTTPPISGRADTTFTPVSSQQLHTAASFTTLSQLPYAGDRTHDFIAHLLDRLPGFELNLGTDLNQIPNAIKGFLRECAPLAKQRSDVDANHAPADMPLITVIVPVYNGAHFLRDAIDSILSQNYPALDIIVVNDGSTDNTDEVVQGLSVDVRYFPQVNLGPGAARNRGIKNAAGNYIAFLDVDDLWPDNTLVRLLDVLQNDQNLDVVHGQGQMMIVNPATQRFQNIGNPEEMFPYSIPAGLYRRSVFEHVGLFDPQLKFGEDTDWYKRAEELQVGIKRLNEVTLLVRRHENNMTRGKSLVEKNCLRVFKKVIDRRRQRAAGENASQPALADANT